MSKMWLVYMLYRRGYMKIRELVTNEDNRRVFMIPSASEKDLYHKVQRLITISNTVFFKCDCIGYVTRAKGNPFFRCRHIKEIEDYLKKDFTKAKKVLKLTKE